MHTLSHQTRRFGPLQRSAVAICAAWLAFSTGSAVAVEDVQLTAVRGQASVSDTALTGRSELPEGQDLKTGDDGNLSVLLDRNAVVEMCGGSQVRFGRNEVEGNRVINIEAGEVKLIIEPRTAGERIEIHTPAAVATILGTVVYVSVDPITGATTISSSQSQVSIRSKDDTAATGTTIDAYEQLTIVPGQEQKQKEKIDEKQIASLASCLLDFHDVAVEIDRIPQETKMVQRVASIDIDMGPASVPGPEPQSEPGPPQPIVAAIEQETVPEPDLTPIDTNPEIMEPDLMTRPIDEIPGEQRR